MGLSGKNSMGYLCPDCEEERKKKGHMNDLSPRPRAMYNRGPEGFRFNGLINCSIHGIRVGIPMHGQLTQRRIGKEDPVRDEAMRIMERTARTLGAAAGPTQGEVLELETYETLEHKFKLSAEGKARKEELIKVVRPDVKAYKPEKDEAYEKITESFTGKREIPERQPGTTEYRRRLASLASSQHRLAKAGAGRIYHAAEICGQQFYKGSTGAIYKHAVLGCQIGGSWRCYAWTETREQAEHQAASLQERSDKQKLHLQIKIVDAVNERET